MGHGDVDGRWVDEMVAQVEEVVDKGDDAEVEQC